MLSDPLWRAEDMGKPVPATRHAVSVALPTWAHVIGYEECDPAVLDVMQSGYPRFFVNRIVRELNGVAQGAFAGEGERVVIFPNDAAAQRCSDFLEQAGRVALWGEKGLGVLIVPEDLEKRVLEYVRYSGELVAKLKEDGVNTVLFCPI